MYSSCTVAPSVGAGHVVSRVLRQLSGDHDRNYFCRVLALVKMCDMTVFIVKSALTDFSAAETVLPKSLDRCIVASRIRDCSSVVSKGEYFVLPISPGRN